MNLVREDVRLRLHAVQQHLERGVRAEEICRFYGISERTLRYGCQHHGENGVPGLRNESRRPRRNPNQIHRNLVSRILQLRRRNPALGALRIPAVLARRGVKVTWITAHQTLKQDGFMVRRVRKPEVIKRFPRKHVDFLWPADVYDFRIGGVTGKV